MKFFKHKIGDLEITQVFDGAFKRPHEAAFASNASDDLGCAAIA